MQISMYVLIVLSTVQESVGIIYLKAKHCGREQLLPALYTMDEIMAFNSLPMPCPVHGVTLLKLLKG